MDFFEELIKNNGVYSLGDSGSSIFEEKYIELRKLEGRILTDQQVKTLPKLENHTLSEEWKLRQQSTNRFTNYLKGTAASNILEIGCGNGWFSHQLMKCGEYMVFGQDINLPELEQAARCFVHPNLKFIQCNDLQLLPDSFFQVIVFNASIQYFETPLKVIEMLKTKLSPNGEIHIIDSPFYGSKQEALAARERSKDYYKSKGVEALSDFYFHHVLADFSVKNIHYSPSKIKKLFGQKNPFYWIQIKV